MQFRVTLTRSLLVLFTVSSCVMSRPTAVPDSPSFCRGDDCPKYTVINKTKDYELRNYEASKWVGTLIASMNWTSALDEGYSMLYKYRMRGNRDKVEIPMATPVATKIEPGQGPACTSNFTILFFVPYAFQKNIPVPNDPKVTIVELPSVKAYVRSFSGDETELRLQESASDLVVALEDDKSKFNRDVYFTAEYDSPERKTDRHNEVWFLAA